ncbi:MAG: putative DNA-binding domain-containing protein [Rhizobiales bacterium]|nr:putative DNA-binding domain-containing protein [Hyphomicrobiales bacterium]
MTGKLASLQSTIQQAILGDKPEAASLVRDPVKGTRGARLDVYRDAYGLRLTEFIANDHPKLKCYMGEMKFTALAHAYISQHRSENPNARWYSCHLADFLRKSPAYSRKPELAELAELERCLNEAFDSADAPTVGIDELAAFDPDQFGAMGFDISPSVRRFKVRTNVTSLWASLRCDELPPHPINLDADQELLVWRQGTASRFRMLGNEEAMALDAARQGVSFAVICEMIATIDDPETAAVRAATFLRGWIEAELIAGLRAPR